MHAAVHEQHTLRATQEPKWRLCKRAQRGVRPLRWGRRGAKGGAVKLGKFVLPSE